MPRSELLRPSFARDLHSRRTIEVELPEFLICALELRVAEANEDAPADERLTVADYVESELLNLLSVRDVVVIDQNLPGFADAVRDWLNDIRQ
jgi:hypothetical protein